MSDLKPCPFCGTHPGHGWFPGDFDIDCGNCHFSISRHISDYGSEEAAKAAAIEAWNSRPAEAELARALIDATAERDALRALLIEARESLAEYVDAEYPEPSRSRYPAMLRLWKRDMDLCWRIDAALQEDTPNG